MKTKSRFRRFFTVAGVGLMLALSVGIAAYVLFTGPRGLDGYPDPAASPYLLPYPAGVTWLCIQSNRGVVSHRGSGEYAYDFKMPEGSAICAARGGTVARVEESRDGHGYRWPNNYIVIDHGDGTSGHYLHLRKGGALVEVGDRVQQGEQIAESGHVGNSSMPHLHFHVTNAERETIPISFGDVDRHQGVPRMFYSYTSGNAAAAGNRTEQTDSTDPADSPK